MSHADFGALIFGLVAQNVLFIGAALWWARKSGRTWASIGLARPSWRQISLGIGGGVAVAVLGYGLGALQDWLLQATLAPATFKSLQRFTETHGAEHLFQQLPGIGMLLAFALVGSLLAPIGEELLFRGLILRGLQERWRLRTGSAIVISSLLFALIHVSPLALLPLFCIGTAFAIVRVRTGSLWIPIGMHAANNAVSFALLAWGGIRY